MNNIVRIELHSGHWQFENIPLADFIAKMKAIRMSAPPEWRDSVMVNIEEHGGCYQGDGYTEFTIYYDRPETDEEVAEREAQTRAYHQRAIDYERAQYEALKRKYG